MEQQKEDIQYIFFVKYSDNENFKLIGKPIIEKKLITENLINLALDYKKKIYQGVPKINVEPNLIIVEENDPIQEGDYIRKMKSGNCIQLINGYKSFFGDTKKLIAEFYCEPYPLKPFPVSKQEQEQKKNIIKKKPEKNNEKFNQELEEVFIGNFEDETNFNIKEVFKKIKNERIYKQKNSIEQQFQEFLRSGKYSFNKDLFLELIKNSNELKKFIIEFFDTKNKEIK